MKYTKAVHMAKNKPQELGSWAVTGTFHGSIIHARTEGEARRIFHAFYNGETIISIRKRGAPYWYD